MKTLLIILVLSLGVLSQASIPKRTAAVATKNIELWCGLPHGRGANEFPYLAAIRNLKLKHNRHVQVVTIYEKNRIVLKRYVNKYAVGNGAMSYASTNDDFALKFANGSGQNAIAGFRAVIHDRDGEKMISHGEFPCYRRRS